MASLAAMGAGALLFCLTWWGYAALTGVSFWGPVSYLMVSFGETTTGVRHCGAGRLLQNLAYLCFWGFNPFLAALFLADGFRRLRRWWTRRTLETTDCLWLCAACVLAGYTFVGGALFGFPKYQCPALPLLCLCLGDFAASRQLRVEQRRYLAVMGVSAFILCAVLASDPLFALRVTLREQMLALGRAGSVVWLSLLPWCLAMLAVLAMVWCARKRVPLLLAAASAGLALNGATALNQSTAVYSTGYVYGEGGECARLARELKANEEARHVKLPVPVEVVHLMGRYDTAGQRPQDDTSPDELADWLERDKPPVFAYSTLCAPLALCRAYRDAPRLNDILARDYVLRRERHLLCYRRKKEGAGDKRGEESHANPSD